VVPRDLSGKPARQRSHQSIASDQLGGRNQSSAADFLLVYDDVEGIQVVVDDGPTAAINRERSHWWQRISRPRSPPL
jgi:hypothetical protein